ncbi:MATE family efflux transporter [Flavobacterium franklandianum]|uniref:Polysaccharide biosynthesis protein n=1 Tax=Flavobacterium franklandianum TaxID=2594430 RepID=A0A553CR30_9FLAO|nr:polysaccharide biosynthesis protein [Flavobacterium franklandianum]TRX22996.1 polysaccharide biosynthesis protein [Flavobacterium franklandianum]
MKNILIKLKRHPKYNTIVSWGKLISITGGAQIIVQAVGFASGILIIRLLPVQEYAYYTLANTMLGTMAILTDGGISTSVLAQGGKVWQNNEKMGIVLATGLDLMRKFGIVSLLVSVPILFYLLVHNGASWLTSLLIALALIPAFYAALSDSVLEIIPKLHQAILPLQKNQVEVGLGRLLLTALTLFLFPWAFVGILASGIPRIWGNFQLSKMGYEYADKNQQPDREIRLEILALVKKIMPTSIYFCVSGQITIWLISIFGNTTSLAQLGALGRISILLSVLGTIIGTLIIPRFAKLALEKKILLQRFIQIMLILIVSSSLIVLFVYFFPIPILWILGKDYKSLNYELVLSFVGSCIGLISGIAFSLYSSRGWALPPVVLITINLLAIIIFASLLDLSSLKGVLYLNIALGLVALLQTTLFSVFKIIQIKK